MFEKARAAGMTGASNPEPGLQPTLEDTAAAIERQRLFDIIEKLVLWENTTNEAVLQPAREEIWKSWRRPAATMPTTRARRSCSTREAARLP